MFNNNGGNIDYTRQHIVSNRDFYDSVSYFNGTVGVGIGTLGSRPNTCRAGVAYWATDRARLYRCSATNTWALYYTAYTYPHPLVGISPPTDLIATSK